MPHDLNRGGAASEPLTSLIEDLLNRTVQPEPLRPYLGASLIGHDCLRRIQYSWMVKEQTPARMRRIFERGHAMEAAVACMLVDAGFFLERGTPACEFSSADRHLQGHCDGIIRQVPRHIPITTPALWEHKCLGSRGWAKLAREGLHVAYPQYHAQVMLYQAYLDLTNPALFTATNADTCEMVHLMVPYDAVAAQAASDKAARVIAATRAGELLPREYDKADDWRCRMCGHRVRCWQITEQAA